MPNFGNYMFQPAPLAYGGMGEGLDSIIQNNQEKARLAQQESQYARTRGDNQSLNAANFGKDNVNTAFNTSKGKYDQQMKAIADARAAMQSGHTDVAEALIPTIIALGGEAQQNPDGTYRFKEGAGPTRGQVDVGSARRQLYQGAPPGTGAGQPFQVPGFGAGGQRNPFEPPAVSGASAAALPPPQSAGVTPSGSSPLQTQSPLAAQPSTSGPPPQPAAAGPLPVAPQGPGPDTGQGPLSAQGQPEVAAPPAAPNQGQAGGQTQQPGSPQPIGSNPFQPPGLDPYTIDPAKVRQRNAESLQPFLGGVANAAGSRFKGRIEAINKYVTDLNLPPAEAIKVTEKLYGEIFAQMRSEVTAEGQSGRLAQMGEHQQSIRDDKSRSFAVGRINKLTDNDNLKDTKKKIGAADEALKYLASAHRNGSSANALIESIYRMKNTGVMTDADFSRSSVGVQSIVGMIEKFALNKLLKGNGGFDPTTLGDMKEVIETAIAAHNERMGAAANSLIAAYRTAPNQIEKDEYERAITSFLPERYLPEEFVQPWMERAKKSGQVPSVAPEDEQATMERMAAEEGNLGVVDNVPAGRHPTTPMARGSRVPPKPPKKRIIDTVDASDMTDEQAEQALRELEEEAAAEAKKKK